MWVSTQTTPPAPSEVVGIPGKGTFFGTLLIRSSGHQLEATGSQRSSRPTIPSASVLQSGEAGRTRQDNRHSVLCPHRRAPAALKHRAGNQDGSFGDLD